MKKVLVFLLVNSYFITTYSQTLLAGWTFDATAAAPNTPSSMAANLGQTSAFLYADGAQGSSIWQLTTSGNELTSQSGTTVNDPRTTTIAGKAMDLSSGSVNVANGKSIVLKLSTVGFKNIRLNYATRATSTGFNNQQWAYSMNGTTFTNVSTNTPVVASTFGVQTVDFSSILSINNLPDVYLKLTFSGATAGTGNNLIDNIVITYDAVLAVDFKSFSASKNNSNNIFLAWQTASEKNNALFNIEHSADGESFFKIGETKGKGNSTVEQNYSFTDANPLRGINYYRLKQVDFDGATTLSKIISIDNSGKGHSKVKVYPSITDSEVNIELSDLNKTEIAIRDLSGRLILSKNTEGGTNQILDLSSLVNGLYFLSVRTSDAIETVKIQKH
jgi:Secretion system C-terminal sorting domain